MTTQETSREFNSRLSQPDGKISFAWDIHYRCNFRCPYCWFFDNWAQQAKRNTYLSPEEWLVHWKRIFKKYGEVRIAITGGEPFLYPRFIDLIRELSAIHIVKITTNMSGDINMFVQEVSPSRVYLDLNFHPLFVKDLDEFIRKVKLLHAAGFDSGVCYLAYPPQMGTIAYYRDKFEQAGVRFALAAFWGIFENKQYPASYSTKEREMIEPYLGDIERVDYHLNAQSPKGKLCNAGCRYVNIQGNGLAVRCAQYADFPIGNIFDENFSLYKTPQPCDRDSCPGNEYNNLISALAEEPAMIHEENNV